MSGHFMNASPHLESSYLESLPAATAHRAPPPIDDVVARAEQTRELNGLSEAELSERRAQMESARADLEYCAEWIGETIRHHDTMISRCERALSSLRGQDEHEPMEAEPPSWDTPHKCKLNE